MRRWWCVELVLAAVVLAATVPRAAAQQKEFGLQYDASPGDDSGAVAGATGASMLHYAAQYDAMVFGGAQGTRGALSLIVNAATVPRWGGHGETSGLDTDVLWYGQPAEIPERTVPNLRNFEVTTLLIPSLGNIGVASFGLFRAALTAKEEETVRAIYFGPLNNTLAPAGIDSMQIAAVEYFSDSVVYMLAAHNDTALRGEFVEESMTVRLTGGAVEFPPVAGSVPHHSSHVKCMAMSDQHQVLFLAASYPEASIVSIMALKVSPVDGSLTLLWNNQSLMPTKPEQSQTSPACSITVSETRPIVFIAGSGIESPIIVRFNNTETAELIGLRQLEFPSTQTETDELSSVSIVQGLDHAFVGGHDLRRGGAFGLQRWSVGDGDGVGALVDRFHAFSTPDEVSCGRGVSALDSRGEAALIYCLEHSRLSIWQWRYADSANLTAVDTFVDGEGALVPGLVSPASAAVLPDGSAAYLGSAEPTVLVFRRNPHQPDSTRWEVVQRLTSNNNATDPWTGGTNVVISPSAQHLYVWVDQPDTSGPAFGRLVVFTIDSNALLTFKHQWQDTQAAMQTVGVAGGEMRIDSSGDRLVLQTRHWADPGPCTRHSISTLSVFDLDSSGIPTLAASTRPAPDAGYDVIADTQGIAQCVSWNKPHKGSGGTDLPPIGAGARAVSIGLQLQVTAVSCYAGPEFKPIGASECLLVAGRDSVDTFADIQYGSFVFGPEHKTLYISGIHGISSQVLASGVLALPIGEPSATSLDLGAATWFTPGGPDVQLASNTPDDYDRRRARTVSSLAVGFSGQRLYEATSSVLRTFIIHGPGELELIKELPLVGGEYAYVRLAVSADDKRLFFVAGNNRFVVVAEQSHLGTLHVYRFDDDGIPIYVEEHVSGFAGAVGFDRPTSILVADDADASSGLVLVTDGFTSSSNSFATFVDAVPPKPSGIPPLLLALAIGGLVLTAIALSYFAIQAGLRARSSAKHAAFTAKQIMAGDSGD